MSSKKKLPLKDQEVSIYFNPLRFSWHIGEMVAGSARPGRYGDIDKDFAHLAENEVRLIVNLCSSALEIPEQYCGQFEQVHVPVIDGHPPESEQLDEIIRCVSKAAKKGVRTVVHCRGGVGRTATVLIPLIMELEGVPLEEAVNQLRKAGRYTQTMEQWEFIQDWSKNKKS